MPNTVANLTVSEIRTTVIQLTWSRPSDFNIYYSYVVNAFDSTTSVKTDSTNVETYKFINLIPGKLYTFYVLTVFQGINSTMQSISSYTSKSEQIVAIQRKLRRHEVIV